MPHTPYSPGSIWSNFFFVSPDEKVLKRKYFADVEEMKQKMAGTLKGIKTDEFKNCFEQWEKCLDRRSASHGEFFEGD